MLNKCLLIIIAFLAVIIITTTVFVKKRPTPQETTVNSQTLEKDFDLMDFGSLRSVTKKDDLGKDATVVFTPCIYFNKNDREFKEELSKKSLEIKEIFKNYFHDYTKDELDSMDENKIKNMLFSRLNSILTLSKIKEIYFKDYIVFD